MKYRRIDAIIIYGDATAYNIYDTGDEKNNILIFRIKKHEYTINLNYN